LPGIRKELLAMLQEDQSVRTGQAPVASAKEVNVRLTERLRRIVDDHGWPGRTAVGERGANAAFLIAQHSDQDLPFQERCLAMMRAKVTSGDVDMRDVAYLEDRILEARGALQRYGTQLTLKAGRWAPQPIEDEARVDERRRAAGLAPLEEYVEDANATLLAR
jgi:hypothetical protein